MDTTAGTPGRQLQATPLDRFDGVDVWMESDDHARLRAYFPLSPGTPNASGVAPERLMVVSMEIQPDDYLPTHTDSNEELLVVLAGTVEATVGDESAVLSTGECAVVPEMVPHSLRNAGDEPARVLGCFPETELTGTFEDTLQPFGTNVVHVGGETGSTEGT